MNCNTVKNTAARALLIAGIAALALSAGPATAGQKKVLKFARAETVLQPQTLRIRNRSVSRVALNSAPWVCTPSGFGLRSRCRARS